MTWALGILLALILCGYSALLNSKYRDRFLGLLERSTDYVFEALIALIVLWVLHSLFPY